MTRKGTDPEHAMANTVHSKLGSSQKRASAKGSKGGRPASGTLEQRLEQLLEDSTQVFVQHGYGSTSMDLIARKAHVAKRTIYQHFGGKEQLFGAVVRHRTNSLYTFFPEIEKTTESIEQFLTTFAHELLTVVLSPDSINLERIVIGEASRFPELAKQFYNNAPRQTIAALAQYLTCQKQREILQVDDPEVASMQFFSLVLGEFQRRALLDIEQPYSAEQINQHVEEVVRFFLNAYQA
ncbi:family transcriptional regulator [Leptolyngbya sp. Heron Island J]|nr:family transcriptional regulator [Leptolyngbya sp. Heron Island J]